MRYGSVVRGCALAVLVTGVAGCNVYDASLLKGNGGDCPDCLHPPPRPVMNDLPSVAETPVFALRNITIKQTLNQAWRSIGYDLDDTLTVTGGTQACAPNPEAGDSAVVAADGTGGIDNVFGAQFYSLIAAQLRVVTEPDLDPEEAARAAHNDGNGTMISVLSDWNGTANDNRVTVTILQAVDGTPRARDEVFLDPTTHKLMLVSNPTQEAEDPAWDPATPDNWWVRSDSFAGGDLGQPLQRDTNAYIANNVVVSTLKEQPIFFRMGDDHAIEVIYRDAFVTAQMNDDHTALTNITVAGRWSIIDLIQTSRGVALCPGDLPLELLHDTAVRWADVASSKSDDGSGAPCDALSMAVTFEAGYPGNWTLQADQVAPGAGIVDYCEGGPGPGPDGGV